MEVEDLKKISSSLTVLLNEKQKQEKVSCFLFMLNKNDVILLEFSSCIVVLFTVSGGRPLPVPPDCFSLVSAQGTNLHPGCAIYVNIHFEEHRVIICRNGLSFVLVPQAIKGKKKKKGVVLGGGMKAKGKDDLADYGEFDGGYTQDYDDFM